MTTPDFLANSPANMQSLMPAVVQYHVPILNGLPVEDYVELPFLSTYIHIIGTGMLKIRLPGNTELVDLYVHEELSMPLRVESIYKTGSTGTFTAIQGFSPRGTVEHDLDRESSFTDSFTLEFF